MSLPRITLTRSIGSTRLPKRIRPVAVGPPSWSHRTRPCLFFDPFLEGEGASMGHEACRPAQSHQSAAGQCGRAGRPLIRMYTPTPLGSRTRRERGGKGESQPRRPAQEQQVVARRRRTAHPTVMPCHDNVHVERIKRSCCKLRRAPGTTQLHGNQPANTNLWVSTVLPRAG